MIIFVCIRTAIRFIRMFGLQNSKKNPVKVLPIRDYIIDYIVLPAKVVLYPHDIAFIRWVFRIGMLPDL